MPKFSVLKGHDAWIVYEAIIEADSAEQAEEFGNADRHASDIWKANGDVREFDHCEVFEGEAEPFEDDEAPAEEDTLTLVVSVRQRDTILAALRLYQLKEAHAAVRIDQINMIADIAADTGAPLAEAEIDELCEEIN